MKFKCRLKVILAEKEIKHGEFANKVEMSSAAFSLIVNNRALPSFESSFKISNELNMDIRDIWIEVRDEDKS